MILAHGVGGRADLPLPVWLFAYSAAFALLISFVALRILWPRPRLAALSVGRPLPGWLTRTAAWLGPVVAGLVLVLFLVTVAAAWVGEDSPADNLAPTALYVVFWVGVPVVSAVLGDVWRRANPLRSIGVVVDRLRGRPAPSSSAEGWWATHWPAALGLLVFHWLELAHHDPGRPRVVAVFITAYAAVMLVGVARFGRGWLRTADGFAVFFSLLATLSPFARGDDGRLRWRVPGSGLARVEPRAGTLAVVLVVLGGTTFDGFSRTDLWSDATAGRRGWELTAVNTAGLLLVVATVAVVFLVATRLVGLLAGDEDASAVEQARPWVASLVPIALAYAIAHYFSLLVFEGQAALALASDPLGRGWDLFGTAGDRIDYTVVSPNQIAYVQVGAIVIGHVAAVVAAHDRAVERYAEPVAVRSQYPLLGAMVAYTVGGLLLLLNA